MTRSLIPAMAVLVATTASMAQTDSPVRAQRLRRRQQEFYNTRAYPAGSIPAGARAEAVREMERMAARERAAHPQAGPSPSWTLIGPRPVIMMPESAGTGTGGGSPYAAGRVASLAVDPRDANVAYMGAAEGGVWKTTDGGQNWRPLTDDQASLAIGSLAIAPSNPDIVYAGTGEQNNSGDSYYGAGVLKSTDGGATWTQLAGPFVGPFSASRTSGGGARIGGLAVHPSNPSIVLAAVDLTPASTAGIYRSVDGGVNWTLALGGATGTEVVFNPADPNIAYAALGASNGSARNGVYKSTDGGATWVSTGGADPRALPSTNVGRIALALAPSNPNVLYAGIQNTSGGGFGALLGLFKTLDGGQTWARLSAPDYCSQQCSYNNIIRVHPRDANIVVAAGLPPYRSSDGGASWTNVAQGSNAVVAHTDHHALAFALDGSRLYIGNDGGVFSTANVTAAAPVWLNLNATLAITEFTSNVSVNPSDPQMAFAGTQDNGSLAYTGRLAWDEIVGGDGGWTAIDAAVPSIMYGAFQGSTVYKLSGVGSLANFFSPFVPYGSLVNGINPTDRTPSYPPIQMDPSNPMRLYFGTFRLYQTNDGSGTWSAVSGDLTASTTGTISAIGISPAAPQTVAVGTNNGKLLVTDTVGQGGAATAWADRSLGLPGRPVTQIAFDPISPGILYATVSGFFVTGISGVPGFDRGGHVFKTTDYGQNWVDISANLPNIPVSDIALDPDAPGTIYVATDIGVFQSTDDGQSWSTLSSGLPKVVVLGLKLHRASRTLFAVTHGRSMWTLSVPLAGAPHGPRIDAVSAVSNAPVTVTGSNFLPTSVVRWNGSDRPTTLVSATTLRVSLTAADLAREGRATALVFNRVAGGGLSNSVNVPVGRGPEVTAAGITMAANPAASSPLVPGSVGSIYGTALAPEAQSPAALPLPYTLGGVTVEIAGIPAPLFYVSPTQINFQTPWELEGYQRATVTVLNGTLESAIIQAKVAVAAPALFSTNGGGSGQGAVTIGGLGVLAAPVGAFPGSRPVKRGEFLEIYATGLGQVSRIQGDGQPKPPNTGLAFSVTPEVTIGGVAAPVSFSGLTPNGVGLYQVNVQAPAGAPLGDAVPVVVTIGGVSSNAVTVAVGQ